MGDANEVKRFEAQWQSGPIMNSYPSYGVVVLASDHDAAMARKDAAITALAAQKEALVVALNEACELLRVARSAMYKLGIAGRGGDALPHETRMFALHFSPAEELELPFGSKVTGDGRLAKFWEQGNAAINGQAPSSKESRDG